MRKVFTILAAVLLTVSVFAQAPQKMSYQAVIRNSSNALVISTQIGMEINIRQGLPTGTVVYTETKTPTTNANGLVSIEIGGGAGFSTINWASNNYYIETKTAVVAPLTTYTITGVSQLLSVPYALNAKTAESITGTITETDPIYTGSQAANITAAYITKLNSLSGTNTGDQDLSGLATTSAITTALNLKVDKVAGKGLSTNDYTTAEKTKLTAITGTNTGDQTLPTLSSLGAVAANTAITAGTNTKISYDAKGLVTAGAAATTADIAASADKKYVTDAQAVVIGNTSGTNTGDNATNTLYSGLVTNATHTGEVTGSGLLTIANNAVTYAKMQTVTASRLLGNPTASAAVPSEITIGSGLSLSTGGILTANGVLVREVAYEFSATASQTAFTLAQTPSANSKVKMYINGIRISNTAYSNTGTTLTYVPASNGSYALSSGDRIQIDYYY